MMMSVRGGSKQFLKGGGQFISPVLIYRKMHTTIYRPFTRKKATFREKKIEPMGGHRPPLNPPLISVSLAKASGRL